MLKPITIRISDKTLKQIIKVITQMHLDKSDYLRNIIEKGLKTDLRDRIIALYEKKELSIEQAAQLLEISPWEFFDLLKERQKLLNVDFEFWKKSAGF